MQVDEGEHVGDRGLVAVAATLAAALVAVVLAGGVLGSRAVAADLRPRVVAALADAGLSDVSVSVRGREVDLRPTRARDVAPAIDTAESVEGVRSVRLDPDLEPADLRPDVAELALSRDGSELRIAGAVPDAASAAALKAAAASTFATTVRGDVRVDPDLPAASWTAGLPGVLPDLAPLKDLGLQVRDGTTLVVSGRIESESGRDRVVAVVRAALPDLEIDPEIAIDPGELGPSDAAVVNDLWLPWQAPAALTADDLARLAAVAEVLERHPDVSVRVDGHTGPDGTAGRAAARAQVALVEDALVAAGVQPGRISVRTYATPPRPALDPRLRRVEIVVREE